MLIGFVAAWTMVMGERITSLDRVEDIVDGGTFGDTIATGHGFAGESLASAVKLVADVKALWSVAGLLERRMEVRVLGLQPRVVRCLGDLPGWKP